MAQYRIYVCDEDGRIVSARDCDGDAHEVEGFAQGLLDEAGAGAGAVEVWQGNRMVHRIVKTRN